MKTIIAALLILGAFSAYSEFYHRAWLKTDQITKDRIRNVLTLCKDVYVAHSNRWLGKVKKHEKIGWYVEAAHSCRGKQ